MLNQALVRIDQIYAGALMQGVLTPDPTLVSEQKAYDTALAAIRAAADIAEGPKDDPVAITLPGQPTAAATQAAVAVNTYVVQFASPDARAVDAALAAVRGISGVQSAATSSIAIGGTSVMRVTIGGDINDLAAALRSRGWQVSAGSNALSIRR